MKIEIARPLMLILLPVCIGFVVFMARYMYSKTTTRKVTQIIMRSLLLTCIVLALSGMSIKWTSKQTTTIFLVDVSDSVREQTDEVISFVNDALETKKANDYVGIIVFGSDAQVEQFVTQTAVFSELQTDVNKTATNLESAMSMALGLIPEDSAKRIVLITDGCENEGSIQNSVSGLAARSVKVLAMKLEENTADEVYVSDITMPDSVGTGELFNINVEIESNIATSATVSLYLGRTLKGQQQVMIQKGTNHFIFTDTQSDEGLKTYNVIVEPASDTVTVNNEYSAYTNISTKQPILIVEGKQGQAVALEAILDSIGVKYNTVVPATVPNTLSDCLEYSAIAFVDVYEDDLREGFTDILESYVKDYGCGFIATGGNNSFALGGYADTPIEEVLPVNMRLNSEQEVPTMSFVMAIDHSGSMSDGNQYVTALDLAKQAAVAALDNVRDTDYIGVLAFDDTYNWLVPIQTAEHRDEIEEKITGLEIGGGTSIYPALEQAVKESLKNDAKVKHIILLTDGEDGYEYSYYKKLIDQINAAGITVSTVAVGDGSNTSLLQQIAEDCGGRMYVTDFESDIPRIFAQEVYLSAESYLKNGEFTPVITSSHSLLSGVAEEGVPNLYGYVATTPKGNSVTMLQSNEGYPILSTWQYGLGRTVAWTSDVTGQWSSQWSGWANTQRLWNNIISYITQQSGPDGAYAEIEQNGKTAAIHYTAGEYSGQTKIVATVTDDAGNSREIELEPDKPGKYQSSFEMEDTGVYSINIKQYEGDRIIGNLTTAAIMQYSMEYQFMNAVNNLEGFVQSVDGMMIEEPEQVFSEKLEMVKSRMDISMPLLLLAILFLLLDIAMRRFHLDPIGGVISASEKQKKHRQEKKREKAAKAQLVKRQPHHKNDSVMGNGAASAEASSRKEKEKKPRKPKGEKKSKPPQNEMLNPSQLLSRTKDKDNQ